MSSNNDTFATAFKLLTLGYSVIPSGAGPDRKAPAVEWQTRQQTPADENELQDYQDKLNPPLWGIVTGAVSGVVVADADDAEAWRLLESEGLQPHVLTPRGGGHFYFQHPGYHVKTCVGILPKLDVRGDGGFVNVTGSSKFGEYRILTLPTLDTIYPWDRLPKRILAALNSSKPAMTTTEGAPVSEGQRNAHLTSLAGSMRRRGMPQAAIEAALLQVNQTQCQPPLPEDEVMRIAGSVVRYQPITTVTTQSFNLTDLGNAERLVSQYGDRLGYCYERKRWLFWTGKVWEWDWGNKVKALAKLAVRNIYHEAAGEPDEKRRKELASHAKSSESDHRINALISLAESEPGIPVKVTELDTNPWLFNCLNGTIDLRTGQLLPHHKEHLLTVIVPVEYYPDAQCPRWFSFLNQVTDGDNKLQGYLQRAVGYSLTGDTKSQVVFLLYGLGNNGKSTFTMTIRKLLAGYGERLDADDLMVKDRKTGGGPKESIANLKGKRYVIGSELQDGRRLDVSLIKDMTGGETIKGRRLYEHDVEFMPTFKLWLYGNHKPVIPDSTLSIWRRVKEIPFTVTIPDNEIDPDLPSKLEAELLGILAWAVKGCLEWQVIGLRQPDAVTTATASYRHEQDILGDFLEDCCILEPTASITKADLKNEYQNWCSNNSVEPITQKTFKARLTEKGIGEGVSSDGKKRIWKGIRLRNEDDTTDIIDKTTNTAKLTDIFRQDLPESPIRGRNKKTLLQNQSEVVSNVSKADMTEIDTEWRRKALQVWEAEGKPVIHLGPGENCFELEKLLSNAGIADRHFKAVKEWLCSRVTKPEEVTGNYDSPVSPLR